MTPVTQVSVDRRRREVKVGGKVIDLTFREFDVFNYLYSARGVIKSREQILEKVWGPASTELRTVDQHVARLRGKLRGNKGIIATVFKVGYKYVGVR